MVTRDLVIKPVYNAFRTVSILSGKIENQTPFRLQANFKEDSLIIAIASQSKEKNKVRVLLSNFIPAGDVANQMNKYMALILFQF